MEETPLVARPKHRLIQNDIEDIRALVERLFNGFDLDNGSGKLHPFGDVNVERERANFDAHINHVREVIEYFKLLHSTHQERAVTKYLNLLKDRATLGGQVEKLKGSLVDCQMMAEDYLAHRVRSKQKILINSLQAIAKKLNLEFYSLPVGDDMDTDVTADTVQKDVSLEAMISSAAFVVDVIVDPRGEVQQANVSYTPGAGEEAVVRDEVNKELDTLLRIGDIQQLEKKLQKLNDLHILYQTYPNPDIRRALKVLEDDILEVHRRERGNYSAHDLLAGSSHGVPEYQCEGLCVHYHAAPIALLRHQSQGEGAKLMGTASVVVGLREASQPVALPLSSHLVDSITEYVTEKVTFDLWLKPAVPMALTALQHLLDKPGSASAHGFQFPSFHNLLCQGIADDFPEGERPSFIITSGLEGRKLAYLFNPTGEETPGVMVEHIPITHHSQLFPIFQYLRQQLVFNELFQSCFGGKTPLFVKGSEEPQKPEDAEDIPVVEVASQPPHSLNITLLHPETQNLLCVSVEVTVGGVVNAQVHSLPGESMAIPSSAYITSLLKRCLSIPMMMKYLLRKG